MADKKKKVFKKIPEEIGAVSVIESGKDTIDDVREFVTKKKKLYVINNTNCASKLKEKNTFNYEIPHFMLGLFQFVSDTL